MKKHFLFSILLLLLCAVPAKAWNNMYLIGSATDAGWQTENAIEMTKINDAEFEWSGELNTGELKFLTQRNWWQMYGPAHDDYSWPISENDGISSLNNLVPVATYKSQEFNNGSTTDYKDYKFKVAESGYYHILINTQEQKIICYAPQNIYPVGNGCEIGWKEGENANKTWEEYAYKSLSETDTHSGILTADLTLRTETDKDGEIISELKFLKEQKWGFLFGPQTNGEEITGIGVYSIAGGFYGDGDRKYKVAVPEEAVYHLEANLRNDVKRNVLKVSKDITFQFKMNARAEDEWGGQPVVIRYWMYYQDADDDNAYDHTFYQTLTPDADGVYTATIQAVAPVKFIIQTCLNSYGEWCGEGAHWTNEATNNGNGYTTDQKFMLVYNNAHVLEEVNEFTDDTYTIRSHKGYASFAWMNAFTVPEGVEAYVGAWKNGDIELSKISDGVVPAYKGVILYDTQLRDTYEVTETTAEPTAYKAMTNDLQGAATGNVTRDENVMTYVLGDIDNVIAFYEYRGDYMPQYKAYLVAPAQQTAVQRVNIRFAPTVTTDITQAETETGDGLIYDIMGRVYPVQDINELPQGIYFRNRTKTVVVK